MKLDSYVKIFLLFGVCFSMSAQAFELSGHKWDSTTLGQGASLTWGYANNESPCRIGSDCTGDIVGDISTSILSEGQAVIDSEIRRAFDSWSAVADLTFAFTTAADPDILIGEHSIDGNNVVAHSFTSFFNEPGLNLAIVNDIHFDTGDTFRLNADFSPGSYFFNVLAHEIGHTLGLSHVDDFESLMNPIVPEFFDGPQADDIAGIQSLYGVSAIPLPAAFWLMFSGVGLLATLKKRAV